MAQIYLANSLTKKPNEIEHINFTADEVKTIENISQSVETIKTFQKKTAAATTIQKIVRGWQTRKDLSLASQNKKRIISFNSHVTDLFNLENKYVSHLSILINVCFSLPFPFPRTSLSLSILPFPFFLSLLPFPIPRTSLFLSILPFPFFLSLFLVLHYSSLSFPLINVSFFLPFPLSLFLVLRYSSLSFPLINVSLFLPFFPFPPYSSCLPPYFLVLLHCSPSPSLPIPLASLFFPSSSSLPPSLCYSLCPSPGPLYSFLLLLLYSFRQVFCPTIPPGILVSFFNWGKIKGMKERKKTNVKIGWFGNGGCGYRYI